ncbi:MAG: Smr/MutS family protein [Planctomycetota bacterium]
MLLLGIKPNFFKLPINKDGDLDLHRFSVSIALGYVYLFLTMTEERVVRVITGKGKHSPNGQAKIKPAVEKFLLRNGYSFQEAPESQGGKGALIIFLKK